MIQYIKGTLEYIEEGNIVIDRDGIGFQISVPLTVIDRLPGIGSEVKIYTYLHVREDILQLFGFLSRDDLDVFKMLITVNGIGPRGGLGILSFMTSDDLRFAVLADDAKTISKAPGIGAKTAGKLILELKDKLKLKDVVESALDYGESRAEAMKASGAVISDAVEALTALGYPSTEAMKAVRAVEVTEEMTVEELLKKSLKNM